MAETIAAWQCVCGRIEAPRPCIGVGASQRMHEIRLVAAVDYEQAAARARHGERALALLRELAETTPRGAWRDAYRRFQTAARRIVGDDGAADHADATAAQS